MHDRSETETADAHAYADEQLALAAETLVDLLRLRPADEYREDMGDVLWWIVPITEPPYCGSPLDNGHTVEVETRYLQAGGALHTNVERFQVGGWPGYHTHFSLLPRVEVPS